MSPAALARRLAAKAGKAWQLAHNYNVKTGGTPGSGAAELKALAAWHAAERRARTFTR